MTAAPLLADTLRIASFNVEMHRKGPGLMLRDILRGDPQARAVAEIIASNAPDILLLQKVDYDADLLGMRALRDVIAEAGFLYPHVFALRPNTGMATGLDLDGDGRTGRASDAQGFGFFAGQRGMVLMSRWPVITDQVQDFSALLWRDLPWATLPTVDGKPFPSEQAQTVQRLSSTGHWIVPIAVPNAPPVTVMAFSATTPVFDGPEDRNGLRNADEIRLWLQVLNGALGTPPHSRFFILGTANLDPDKGQGRHAAIRDLLSHPTLQDPKPQSATGGLNTADWSEPTPGDMRVDYVLPSTDWTVTESGVVWPDTNAEIIASRHRLVWVDVDTGTDEGF
nr:endonuclease/exonuclease/phosphatase family protein [uncultured Shimia sp.]